MSNKTSENEHRERETGGEFRTLCSYTLSDDDSPHTHGRVCVETSLRRRRDSKEFSFFHHKEEEDEEKGVI